MIKLAVIALILASSTRGGCSTDSDEIQAEQQETILREGTSAVGMPAIRNFRERRLLKSILEMRDSEISTFTYLASPAGDLKLLCSSIGYGIPYSTQYTNPQKSVYSGGGSFALPQADPNGLFSPESSDGTWVMCKNPNGNEVSPVLIEPRIVVSPFPLVQNVPAPGTSSDVVDD